jgi:hypothetical protein
VDQCKALVDGFGGKSYTKMGNKYENLEWRQGLTLVHFSAQPESFRH